MSRLAPESARISPRTLTGRPGLQRGSPAKDRQFVFGEGGAILKLITTVDHWSVVVAVGCALEADVGSMLCLRSPCSRLARGCQPPFQLAVLHIWYLEEHTFR